MNKLVSIIIPVYNSSKFLQKCIESILNNTYKIFEIILVCDKGKDNSEQICLNYANTHSNIKTLIQEKPLGVSHARNIGLDNISINSEYICFIDADDYIEPDYLQVMVNNIEEFETDISICSYKRQKPNNKFFNNSKLNKIEVFGNLTACKYMFIMQKVSGACWDKLFITKIIGNQRFVENIYYGEDTLFCFEYLLKCKSAVWTNKKLYHYINQKNNAMNAGYSLKRLTFMNSIAQIKAKASNINQTLKTYSSSWYFLMAVEIMFYLKQAKITNGKNYDFVYNIIKDNYKYFKSTKNDYKGFSKFGNIGAFLLLGNFTK